MSRDMIPWIAAKPNPKSPKYFRVVSQGENVLGENLVSGPMT